MNIIMNSQGNGGELFRCSRALRWM